MKGNRIGLFYLYTALFWATLYAYMPFMTPFALKIGATEALAGLIVGGYGLVQMFFRIPLGILSDRIRRRKPFVVLGIAVAAIAPLGMYFFTSPAGLLGFRAFAGIAAASWVTITVLFSSYFDPALAPRAMGNLNASNQIGIMLAGFAGARIAQATGDERYAFLFAAGLGACALVVSLFLRENRPENAKPIAIPELLRVGATPVLLAVSLIAVLLNMIGLGTTDSFTQKWATDLNATTGELGLITFAVNIPFTLAAMLGGNLLLRRFRPRALVISGALVMAVAVFLIPFAPNMPALLACLALQGLGTGLCSPMLMSLAILTIPQEKRGVAMGFFQSIYALGMFLGPVLSGAISQALDTRYAFFIMSALAVVMALMGALMIKREA